MFQLSNSREAISRVNQVNQVAPVCTLITQSTMKHNDQLLQCKRVGSELSLIARAFDSMIRSGTLK